jgi:serine O-acetyltransferase
MTKQRSAFRADLGRYMVLMGRTGLIARLRLIVYSPGIWITFLFRVGQRLSAAADRFPPLKILSVLYRFQYFLAGLAVGIDIPLETRIGAGLYIGHWGGITVGPKTVLGENCNLSQGVTIGEAGREGGRGVPVIGDRVYLGPGAKVFGKITVGNDVAIGANAVVGKDVPDSAVVGGVPAEIISMKGSADFVIVREDGEENG